MSENVTVTITERHVGVFPCVSIVMNTYGDDFGDTIYDDTARVTFGDPHVEHPMVMRSADPEAFVVGRRYRVVYTIDECEQTRSGKWTKKWKERRIVDGVIPEEVSGDE